MKLVVCFMVAACGGVTNPVADAPKADASADAASDAAIDTPAGPSCVTDGFDGSVLAGHWSVLVGAAPVAYDVSGSRLFISDAPFATTPSMPMNSWIYDLDTDKGNQLAWAQAIGGEDFTLSAELGWSSTLPELTLGGVGIADAQGTLAAVAGITDGVGNMSGGAYATLHVVTGPDTNLVKPPQEPGSARVKIQRVHGTASISIDDVEVVTGPLPAVISNIVIYYVRHQASATPYNFGSLEVRQVQLCRS
jgi:hypothetical protein